jgi:hypothetical protein
MVCLTPKYSYSGELPPAAKWSIIFTADTTLSNTVFPLSEREISSIGKKYKRLNRLIQHRSEKMLNRLESRELTLQNEMQSKDSIKTKELFDSTQQEYQRLKNPLQSPVINSSGIKVKEYIPGLDSIQTAFKYLQQRGANISGLSAGKLQQIQLVSQQIEQLQGRLQQAEDAQQFIKMRGQRLKDQLNNFGVGAQLAGINKEAFYAQQQVIEYKEMIRDRRKLEHKVLSTLNDVPAFQQFMQRNSYLGQLFGLPDDYGSSQSLVGLQTRTQVQQLISQVIGSGSGSGGNGDPSQYIQNQVGMAHQQMDQLKDKLKLLGNSGGGGDITMPDSKPNGERTKTFLRRVILGFNLQTQQTTSWMPAAANIALTAGYKFSGNIVAGIGGSYRLGVGTGWNHIAFSSQGLGIRSYLDIRARGGFWISGGIEYNYLQSFRDLPDLRKPDLWQQSALIGVTKKYKIRNGKESSVQLLFDALYKQHIPSSPPVVFRTGLSF